MERQDFRNKISIKMKIKSIQNKIGSSGFSLVEIIIYVALTSVLLLTVSGFSIVIMNLNNSNKVASEVEYQGIQMMQIITQHIRNANSITTPVQGSSSNNYLSLVMPSGTPTPAVFSLSDGNLYINEGGAGNTAINNSKVQITNLLFENLSRPATPGVIMISFTLDYLNPGGKAELNYSKNFYATASLR